MVVPGGKSGKGNYAQRLASRLYPFGKLRRIFLSVVLVRVLTVLSTFAFGSLLTFWLSKETYGALAALMSLCLLAAAVGEFGQRDLMAREIAKLQARGAVIPATTSATLGTAVAATGGLVVGLAVAAAMLVSGASPMIAFLAFTTTAMLCVNGAWSGIGRGRGQFFWAIAPREVLWRTIALGVIGLSWAVWSDVGLTAASQILVLSLFVALIGQFVAIGSPAFSFDLPQLVVELRRSLRERLRSGFDVMLVNVSDLVLVTLDVAIVAMISGDEMAAEYYPANRMALLAFTAHILFQLVLAPQFARLFELGELDEARKASSTYARFSFGVTLATVAVLSGCGPLFGLVFETATDTTWAATMILSSAYLLYAAGGLSSILLVAARYERKMRIIMIVTTGIGTILMLVCAYLFGPLGVAAAVVATTAIRVIAVAGLCGKSIGFAGTIFG